MGDVISLSCFESIRGLYVVDKFSYIETVYVRFLYVCMGIMNAIKGSRKLGNYRYVWLQNEKKNGTEFFRWSTEQANENGRKQKLSKKIL